MGSPFMRGYARNVVQSAGSLNGANVVKSAQIGPPCRFRIPISGTEPLEITGCPRSRTWDCRTNS